MSHDEDSRASIERALGVLLVLLARLARERAGVAATRLSLDAWRRWGEHLEACPGCLSGSRACVAGELARARVEAVRGSADGAGSVAAWRTLADAAEQLLDALESGLEADLSVGARAGVCVAARRLCAGLRGTSRTWEVVDALEG